MHIKKEKIWPMGVVCLILIILGIPAFMGLLQGKMVNGHDAASNLMMAFYTYKYTGDGQFLIRWATYLNYGYGYPMFNFYPPAFFLPMYILAKLIGNVIISMNLTAVCFWVLSGLGMFLLAREFWGQGGGLLSAIAYMYAPYHVQDIYIRFAFSESNSFALFPLILWSFYKIGQKFQRRHVLLGVLCIFTLGCGHTLMFMLFAPVAAAYLLFLSFIKKDHNVLLTGIFMLCCGWMMSAFYWLAAFYEKQFLNTSFLISYNNDFHINFVAWQKLFHLPWCQTDDQNGISFQLGLALLLTSLVPLIFIKRLFKQDRQAALHYLFFGIMAAAAIFFLLKPSTVFWEHLSLLKFVQLPWRFLGIVNFAMAFMAGASMSLIRGRRANFILIIAIFLIMAASIKFYAHVKYMDPAIIAQKNDLNNVPYIGEGISTPQWIKFPILKAPAQKFEFLAGRGVVVDDTPISSIEHFAQITADEMSLICFHSYYFPGWKVKVDGQDTQIYPNNPYGLIVFKLEPGVHNVRVYFGSTAIRNIAVMVSWAGFALLIAALLLWRDPWQRSRSIN